MKQISQFINEATDNKNQVWVAIQDDYTPNSYDSWDKPRTSYRVVTAETFKDLKDGTKKNYGNHEYTELGRSRNKEEAQSYLPSFMKTARKSKINKGDADYIVYAISSGKMNPSGSTKWDWNFWEEWKDSEIYIDKRFCCSFLMGAPGSLKVGDKVFCVDNDTQKKLTGAPTKIDAVCKCNIEDFRETYRKLCPERCKSPKISFGRKIDGLPWQRMGQFYSIKGVSD